MVLLVVMEAVMGVEKEVEMAAWAAVRVVEVMGDRNGGSDGGDAGEAGERCRW